MYTYTALWVGALPETGRGVVTLILLISYVERLFLADYRKYNYLLMLYLSNTCIWLIMILNSFNMKYG